MNVVLRDSDASDADFLLRLYCESRKDEMATTGWDAGQIDAFLRMQHNARTIGYAARYPNATDSIILHDDEQVGRMLVDRSSEEIRLVDIALLRRWQGKGIATALVRQLLESGRAEGKVVRLHVSTANPARSLYERLGFTTIEETEGYLLMESGGVPS